MGLISRVSSRTYRNFPVPTNHHQKVKMPVKYGDLSKKADDLFKKGFEHEHHKLEISSKSSGCEFTTKGALKGGAISSSHEMKLNDLCPLGGKLKATFTPGKDSAACEYEYSKVAKVTACFALPLNGCPVPKVNEVKVNWSNDKAHLNVASDLGNKLAVDVTADPNTLTSAPNSALMLNPLLLHPKSSLSTPSKETSTLPLKPVLTTISTAFSITKSALVSPWLLLVPITAKVPL